MSTQKDPQKAPKKVTATTLQKMKVKGERISMVTAYDATFARLVEEGGAEVILVGDSLGMVVQGEDNTLGVTIEDIIYHSRAVSRGAKRAHIVADMPFMSYQADPLDALKNAGRLIKEGQAHAVKMEGGKELAPIIRPLVQAGIPVMGHLGLTPQSIHAMGGFKVQGREAEAAARILEDAKALEAAGAYAIVPEGIPVELSRVITQALSVPTIGIGAGIECDGQVLVIYDLLGMDLSFKPKFVKRFETLGKTIPEAMQSYTDQVKSGEFPAEEQTFHTKKQLFGPRELVMPAPIDVEEEDGIGGLHEVPM